MRLEFVMSLNSAKDIVLCSERCLRIISFAEFMWFICKKLLSSRQINVLGTIESKTSKDTLLPENWDFGGGIKAEFKYDFSISL